MEVIAVKRIMVGAAASAAALALILGASAHANPYDRYAGQTYAKVQKATGGKVTIASRVGEYLATEDCIVTGSRRFTASGGNTLLVDLNCNDPRSAGGDGSDHAGYSVASPEGKKMEALKERAINWSKNYENAVAAGKPPICEKYYDSCVRVCQQSGACSDELLEYLGV